VRPSTFDRLNFSEVGQAMIVTGLVLLVSAAVLLLTTEAKLRQSNSDVQRTTSTLLQIQEIESLVIGVDYSARGYALTGQALFLDHEHEKQARLKQAVLELSALSPPSQRADVKKLGELAETHAAVYAALVSQGPNHVKEVAAAITDPGERKKRFAVIAALDSLRQEALHALAREQADAVRQLRHTSILTFIIVAIAFLGGTSDVMARIWRDQHRRHTKPAPP
jgi:CHASE3 domain sensor protein